MVKQPFFIWFGVAYSWIDSFHLPSSLAQFELKFQGRARYTSNHVFRSKVQWCNQQCNYRTKRKKHILLLQGRAWFQFWWSNFVKIFLPGDSKWPFYPRTLEVTEPLKGSLNDPKKVTKNCQVYVCNFLQSTNHGNDSQDMDYGNPKAANHQNMSQDQWLRSMGKFTYL